MNTRIHSDFWESISPNPYLFILSFFSFLLFFLVWGGFVKDYYEEENEEGVCLHHSGGPVFHEGLKGWSCCQKRVVDFDEFMKIPGCTTAKHSSEKPAEVVPASKPAADAPMNVITADGVEVYNATSSPSPSPATTPAPSAAKVPRPTAPKEVKVEEPEDDPTDFKPVMGAPCKRRGCSHFFDGNDESDCQYHSGEPIFHEGSKGWSCCSRKVLEFEEFMKIKGCKQGKHRYSEPVKKQTQVQCRFDWYQTPTTVIMSLFAKNVNKEATKITFEPYKVNVAIVFQNGDVYDKEFVLFEQIDPAKSKFTLLSVKIEMNLAKANGLSWADLQPTDKITQWTTFGVQGRVGTIGSKEIIYAGDSPILQKD